MSDPKPPNNCPFCKRVITEDMKWFVEHKNQCKLEFLKNKPQLNKIVAAPGNSESEKKPEEQIATPRAIEKEKEKEKKDKKKSKRKDSSSEEEKRPQKDKKSLADNKSKTQKQK